MAIEKITDYLLSEIHPEGRGKAAFFRRLGFRKDEPYTLRWALLQLARQLSVDELEFPFGLKYVGVGPITCPDGRQVDIVTVWVLRDGRPPPYFVTAYPA